MATQAKTVAEVIERLNKLVGGDDEETAHGEADLLLCDALIACGRSDVVSAWQEARDRVGFWYA